MGMYRKKPVVIEAHQWNEGDSPLECMESRFNRHYYIETLEGRMIVSDGDFIITGVNGENYPCKPDIFEKTYEKVEE